MVTIPYDKLVVGIVSAAIFSVFIVFILFCCHYSRKDRKAKKEAEKAARRSTQRRKNSDEKSVAELDADCEKAEYLFELEQPPLAELRGWQVSEMWDEECARELEAVVQIVELEGSKSWLKTII